MSISDQYRSSTEYREILRILQKATTFQENFLWQSHVLGKTIIPIQYIEIDFISREVMVSFNAEHYRVDSDLPIYVKLDYRTSVFKVTNYRRVQNVLYFSFPELIKTQELRKLPRHTFKPTQDKFVTLRSSSPNMREGGGELKVRAMDISQYGLGLVVSEQNRNFLKNNRILWITGLQDQILENPVLAEVVYINSEIDPKFMTKKQKSLKVGLKISGIFPEPTYRSFLQ